MSFITNLCNLESQNQHYYQSSSAQNVSFRDELATSLFREVSKLLEAQVADKQETRDAAYQVLAEIEADFRNGKIPLLRLGTEFIRRFQEEVEKRGCAYIEFEDLFQVVCENSNWNQHHQNPLVRPLLEGDLATFEELVKTEDLNIPAIQKDFPNLLSLALQENQREMASLLIKHGIGFSVFGFNSKPTTIFEVLIKNGDFDTFQWILNELSHRSFEIPLSKCLNAAILLFLSHPDEAAVFIRFLLQQGTELVDLRAISRINLTNFEQVVGSDWIQRLIQQSSDETCVPLLKKAISSNSSHLAKQLIARWNPSIQDLIKEKNDKIVMFYLQNFHLSLEEKKDIFIKILSSSDFPMTLQLLIETLHENLPKDPQIIFELVKNGRIDILQNINGIDWGMIDSENNTLLHAAYKAGQLGTAEYLKTQYDYENTQNNLGETASLLEARARSKTIVYSKLDPVHFETLLQQYGPERVLQAMNEIYRRTPKKYSAKLPIESPNQLLSEWLRIGPCFFGQLQLVRLENNGIPIIEWSWEKPIEQADSFEITRQEDEAFLNSLPEKRNFVSKEELNLFFNHFKTTIPSTYILNGCFGRAYWIAYVLQVLLKYKVEMHVVYPPNGTSKLMPEAPFPPEADWVCHAVPIVYLNDGSCWVLDTSLPEPLPFEEWRKHLHTPTQGTDLIEDRREHPLIKNEQGSLKPLSEIVSQVGALYLMERVHNHITTFIQEDWMGPSLVPL